jgi:hypothetical protein
MSRKFKLPTKRVRGKTKRWSINPKLYEKIKPIEKRYDEPIDYYTNGFNIGFKQAKAETLKKVFEAVDKIIKCNDDWIKELDKNGNQTDRYDNVTISFREFRGLMEKWK